MNGLKRGMVIDIDLEPVRGSETGKIRPCVIVTNDTYNERLPVVQVVPITGWTEKKSAIVTNVVIDPTEENGLTKKSVADCLQTRPIDHRPRLVRIRGSLDSETMEEIDHALKTVFGL
ncbi:MAG: type II toxin-antitoxin system PemK/MazF family toxin [Bacteroidetes bacterium]|nr:type II toxin-antitoxin system PemK/MazF family toxin [Bacteroidota bacterium]